MAGKKKVGLVGVTGYTGMELSRILLGHPDMELTAVTSRKESGRPLSAIYPFLQNTALQDLEICAPDAEHLARECDMVFLAVPHGTAMEMGAALVDAGAKVVDLSADFRIRDAAVYADWYGLEHTRKSHIEQAAYGLPELYADQVRDAVLVANPGCYPTSVILGLYPALAKGVVHTEGIVIDSKSGTSGAGRKANVGALFCEVHDSFKAYGLGKHRHTPEIEQEISLAADKELTVSFNTHLLPIDRGILSTTYTQLKGDTSLEEIHGMYTEFYAGKPWVRVLPMGVLPETRWVRGTMFCDIGLVMDPRTNRLIIVSAIDNLCRGASGQAVANANLMLGLNPQAGLDLAPMMP